MIERCVAQLSSPTVHALYCGGAEEVFIVHSSPASYCAEKSLEDLEKFFVVIKIFHRTKCPADQKLCRTKPNFEIFSETNVQCPAPFQGSKRNSQVCGLPQVWHISNFSDLRL